MKEPKSKRLISQALEKIRHDKLEKIKIDYLKKTDPQRAAELERERKERKAPRPVKKPPLPAIPIPIPEKKDPPPKPKSDPALPMVEVLRVDPSVFSDDSPDISDPFRPLNPDEFRLDPIPYDERWVPARARYFVAKYGLSIADLGRVFCISPTTVSAWMRKYPSFREAVQLGQDEFRSLKVEDALFRRATGYPVVKRKRKLVRVNEQDFDTGEMVTVEKLMTTEETIEELAPDVSAATFWLKNRSKDRWKEETHTTVTLDLAMRLAKARKREQERLFGGNGNTQSGTDGS